MSLPLKTIVIVDDEPGLVNLLKEVITASGYEVLGTALNGADGVELVKKTRPNVVVLDFHMPVKDGLQATSEIVTLGTTAVVMLTADADQQVARKAMDNGASGYMQKPFDRTQIVAILESAWHRFQTITALQEKNRQLDEALELRKLLEKAKGILMEQQGFSEDEAHKCLLKMSQDQGILLKEVCRSVIQVRMVLGNKKAKRVA